MGPPAKRICSLESMTFFGVGFFLPVYGSGNVLLNAAIPPNDAVSYKLPLNVAVSETLYILFASSSEEHSKSSSLSLISLSAATPNFD